MGGEKLAQKNNVNAGDNLANKPEVIIYTSPNCKYCGLAKAYFNESKIAFEEIDISSDRKKAQEMLAKNGGKNSTPTLEINGRIVMGFQRELIDEALSRPKPRKREDIINNMFFDLLEL